MESIFDKVFKAQGDCRSEILSKAVAQEPCSDGIRRSRWAIVVSSERELRTTYLRPWLDAEPSLNTSRESKYKCVLRFDDVELEVLFNAASRVEDHMKLAGLELTGAWVSHDMRREVVHMLLQRVGRYKSPTWFGILQESYP